MVDRAQPTIEYVEATVRFLRAGWDQICGAAAVEGLTVWQFIDAAIQEKVARTEATHRSGMGHQGTKNTKGTS